MSSKRFNRVIGFLFVLLCVGGLSGCKKKVPTPPPVEQPRPAELAVFSVRPNEGRADQTTSISVAGSGFQSGARVFIGDTAATDVAVSGTESVRATVPSGLEPGSYNIIVRNPDGKEAVLQNGFTVRPIPRQETPASKADCELKSVTFDFDMSSISDEARGILQRDLECLKTRNAKRVEITGHTDERGSTDYNLALGQRRADEVKRYLSQLGFGGTINTISYGEEQPAVEGTTEDAYSQNRRAEITIRD